jgi:hypothetical protein
MLAAAALTLCCASAQLTGGPESPVRLDTPEAVGWEPGGPFNLDLTIYNATGHRITLVTPSQEALQVKIFRITDGKLVCKTPAPTQKIYEGPAARFVRAANGLKFRADIWPYCRNLGEGTYRYEAVYVANQATSGTDNSFTGTIGPQGGRIVVRSGISTDEGALEAALAAPASQPEAPGTPVAEEPAAPTDQPAAAKAPAPAKPAEGAAPAATVNPEAIRACVDRELASRGLNAYGDPQGTKYDDHPPVDEGGRILYVASRLPEIRYACRISGF